jgi:hypothetical protein
MFPLVHLVKRLHALPSVRPTWLKGCIASLLLMNLTPKGVERTSSYAREGENDSSARLRVRTPRPPFEGNAQLTGHRTA